MIQLTPQMRIVAAGRAGGVRRPSFGPCPMLRTARCALGRVKSRQSALYLFVAAVLWWFRMERRQALGVAASGYVRFSLAVVTRCSLVAVAAAMIFTTPTIIDVDMNRLEDVLRRAEAALDEEDYSLIKAVVESYAYVANVVGDKNTTIRRLRKLLFGASTEKTAAVLGPAPPDENAPTQPAPKADGQSGAEASGEKPDAEDGVNDDGEASNGAKGHGRNGADAYTAAEDVAEGLAKKPASERRGLFTSGVVSTREGRRIALFFSGRKHAGENLKDVLVQQFDQRRVEPNSALGGAITYLLKRWEKLMLFLRVPGAPLDNNLCERALKKAIRHRRNSLFYKTSRGARVGDVFMSLIHTCELCKANPFDYLTAIERHAAEASAEPGRWMPWNYRQTLAEITTSPAAVG